MSELRFEEVTVRYGDARRGLTAVDRVSLVVPDDAVVGLVGESGSGKSTLARAAVGLAPVTGGRILLDGAPVPPLSTPVRFGHRRARRRPVQLVFQDPHSSLDPRMSVGDSVAEALPPGSTRAERRREVARLLGLVHLEADRAAAYPAELSGGQRQRVALARALAARPEVIVADEITSALDVSIQGSVLNLVRELQRELGLSMLFISHDLAVVRYVATHLAVMYLGQVVEHGPAHDVLAAPRHPYTVALLRAARGGARHGAADPAEGQRTVDLAAEPPDPHRPPTGCRYHLQCPVGPLVHPERTVCVDESPGRDHAHDARCHFAS